MHFKKKVKTSKKVQGDGKKWFNKKFSATFSIEVRVQTEQHKLKNHNDSNQTHFTCKTLQPCDTCTSLGMQFNATGFHIRHKMI